MEIVGAGPVEGGVESDSAECLRSTASGAVVRGLTLRCTAGRNEVRAFGVLIEQCDLLVPVPVLATIVTSALGWLPMPEPE
jgi:hypothetical protein